MESLNGKILCKNQRLNVRWNDKHWLELHILNIKKGSSNTNTKALNSILKHMGFDDATVAKAKDTKATGKSSKDVQFAQYFDNCHVSLIQASNASIKLLQSQISILDSKLVEDFANHKEYKDEEKCQIVESNIGFGDKEDFDATRCIFVEECINTVLNDNPERKPMLWYGFGGTAQGEWIRYNIFVYLER